MKLSGFTDEAAKDLAGQIIVTKELGWEYLSLRMVDGVSIHDLPKDDFLAVCDQLEAAQLKVAEFGTLIGSWSKTIDSDWNITLQEIERCIPRMQRLGVQYARIMSYAQRPWGEDQAEQERFRRLREITQRFADAGLTALHENCMNWGGFSADHTLRLLEEVPGLKLVFDTGNPVFQRDRSQKPPYPWQDAFDFYRKVKQAIAHVHVKDGIMHAEEGEPEYTFAGEGQARIPEILKDLLSSDYQGFLAIEPHIGKVFHLQDQEKDPDREYHLYLEYGQRFEQLVKGIREELK
ncbi:MAG TPA: TIM barrel protein [Saprospiraceae bacterium]|nr:TIM barrel protein [Saprospiraceae bacterium]